MSTPLKELHDRLLAERPDGAEHDEATCPMCAMENSAANINGGGASTTSTEGGLMTTLTQEEHEAALQAAVDKAVADAIAPLTEKIAEYEAAAADSEIGKAVADATAPLNEKITEIQTALDAAVLAQAAAETKVTEIETFWADAIAEQEATDAAAARKDDRLAKVRETANFPEDYLTEHADRIAAMSDEDFEARLGEWSVIAPKANAAIPAATGLQAAREGGAANNQGSALAELKNLRGLSDPRTV